MMVMEWMIFILKMVAIIVLIWIGDLILWSLFRSRFFFSPSDKFLDTQSNNYTYRDANKKPINKSMVIKEFNCGTKQPQNQTESSNINSEFYYIGHGYAHLLTLNELYLSFIIKWLSTKSKQNQSLRNLTSRVGLTIIKENPLLYIPSPQTQQKLVCDMPLSLNVVSLYVKVYLCYWWCS